MSWLLIFSQTWKKEIGKSNNTPYVFLQSSYKLGAFNNSADSNKFIENKLKMYLSEISPFILWSSSSGVTE